MTGKTNETTNADDFLDFSFPLSPVKDTIVVNDRWGNTRCQHGDYYDCSDRYHPCELLTIHTPSL